MHPFSRRPFCTYSIVHSSCKRHGVKAIIDCIPHLQANIFPKLLQTLPTNTNTGWSSKHMVGWKWTKSENKWLYHIGQATHTPTHSKAHPQFLLRLTVKTFFTGFGKGTDNQTGIWPRKRKKCRQKIVKAYSKSFSNFRMIWDFYKDI